MSGSRPADKYKSASCTGTEERDTNLLFGSGAAAGTPHSSSSSNILPDLFSTVAVVAAGFETGRAAGATGEGSVS